MRRISILLVCLAFLNACGLPSSEVSPPVGATPEPTLSATQATPASTVWAVDSPRRIDRAMGYARGPRIAVDERGHAHIVYQNSVEWMDERNDGGVIVIGTTPANDRYEVRLSTGDKGFASNGIGVFGSRIIVTAGIADRASYRTVVWQSLDGGTTWSDRIPVQVDGTKSYQMDVAFFPDGRAVLVASVRVSETSVQTQLLVERDPESLVWDIDRSIPAAPAGAGAGSDHTVLMRPISNMSSDLPAIIVIARRSGGFWVVGSVDGHRWDRIAVDSATIHYPHIAVYHNTVIVTHTVYGQAGLWVAWSSNGLRDWNVRQPISNGAGFTATTYRVATAYPIIDPSTQTLFLLIERMGPQTERRFVLVGVTLTNLDTMDWQPRWNMNTSWMPIALPLEQSHQTQLGVMANASMVAIVWVGRWTPQDFPQTKMVDADYRPTEDLMYTTIRPSSLTNAWKKFVRESGQR